MTIADNAVLVTGANRGIGQALAKRCSQGTRAPECGARTSTAGPVIGRRHDDYHGN
jgi:NAD(P)-dependent dehydrogenase (short-subunit alcohol dehydrogenase family)